MMNLQTNIKALWKQFKDQHKHDIENIKEKRSELLKTWENYSKKIKAGTLTLDEYTNVVAKADYLCHFLERQTTHIFGSSNVAGSANSLMVKRNNDDTYYIHKHEKGKKKGEIKPNSRDDAEKIYEGEVLPIFKAILNAEALEEKLAIAKAKSQTSENQTGYVAKSFLRKIIALEHPKSFIYYYSTERLQLLYDQLGDGESGKKLDEWELFEKNAEIKANIAKDLELPEDDEGVEDVLLTWFIYRLLDTQSIADDRSPNVILYGPPGTGKTYEVKQMLDFVCKGDDSLYELLQFHPSYTYEDFIEGIKPTGVDDNGNIQFGLVNGHFKTFCMKARKNSDKNFYFVVDEINRANLSAVFGETLSLLEKGYRHDIKLDEKGEVIADKTNLIKTQYSAMVSKGDAYEWINGKAYFGVPKNVFFIGMMNDVDKSIDTFDLALRRRFKWIRKDCDYEVIRNNTLHKSEEPFENIEQYAECAKKLNQHINETLGLGKSYEFGHAFFMKISDIALRKNITSNNLEALFDLHLRPTLKEYLRAFYPETDIDKKDGKLDEALAVFKNNLKETDES